MILKFYNEIYDDKKTERNRMMRKIHNHSYVNNDNSKCLNYDLMMFRYLISVLYKIIFTMEKACTFLALQNIINHMAHLFITNKQTG